MSSGGSKQPANTTQTTTTIPKFAEPYAMEMLGRNQALNQTGYQQYTGQRLAGFNPMQEQAFNNVYSMQTSPHTQQAAGLAGLAGLRAGSANYTPAQTPTNLYNSPQYSGMDVTYQRTSGPTVEAAMVGDPERVNAMMIGADSISSAGAGTVRAGDVRNYQMNGVADVGTDAFNKQVSDAYMSPYMQNVVDQQQKAALRQAQIAAQRRGFQAATSGAFGSSRQALENSEANRALADQLDMLQAKGLQDAYSQGQQQFNTDQARALQAALANQQTQFGVGRENLGANLGVQQLKFQGDLQASTANQQAALQASIANQNAALQRMLANQSTALNAGQFNANLGMQAGLANQRALMDARSQNANLGMTSQQLNQAAQLQAQQQALGQNQFMNQFNQQNADSAARYGLEGLNFGEQSRQFGANYGMQGLQQLLASSGQLGQLGNDYYNQQMGINNNMLDAGGRQQALEQAYYDTQYQDFMDRLNFPYRQLSFTSDILHGLPTNQTSTVYGYPNTGAQAAGTLGGLASLYMAGKG